VTGIGPVAGSDPYPWPWGGSVAPSRLALVLCGWDTHWAARSVGDAGPPMANVGSLVAAVDACGGLVIAVAHPRPARAAADLPDPVPLAVPGEPSGVVCVAAGGIDGFYASRLDHLLRSDGRTHLLVSGHGLEGPVHSTLRTANDAGYECLLVTDACTPLTTEAAASAAHSVTMSGGIFGAIGLTAAVLDALSPLLVTPTAPTPLEDDRP
jgi:biuret amidohydrolase